MSSAGEPFHSGRLWSLWDMFNFQMFNVCNLVSVLRHQEDEWRRLLQLKGIVADILRANGRVPPTIPQIPEFLEEADKNSLRRLLDSVLPQVEQLGLQAVKDRIDLFRQKLISPQFSHDDFLTEIRVLREMLEASTKHIWFYHYPKTHSDLLEGFPSQWSLVITKFPSSRQDALAAVDCWASGHGTASVFHSMRVAELGLRALARERRIKLPRKPLEWANWEDMLSQLRKKIEKIG